MSMFLVGLVVGRWLGGWEARRKLKPQPYKNHKNGAQIHLKTSKMAPRRGSRRRRWRGPKSLENRALCHPSGAQNAAYVTQGGPKMAPWSPKGVPKGRLGHPRGSQREVKNESKNKTPKREHPGDDLWSFLAQKGSILGPPFSH